MKKPVLFTETVSNPALEVADLEAISAHAKECGVPLIVDSTFSTPYLTNPLAHGADIVVHSLTKWFGGHGTGIGGIVVDSDVLTGLQASTLCSISLTHLTMDSGGGMIYLIC